MNKREEHTTMDFPQSLTSAIRILRVARGFKFTEGPVWHPSGCLLFSDTPSNNIWRFYEDGRLEIAFEKSGLSNDNKHDLSDMIGSNGLAIDSQGDLYICQHGDHAIARLDMQNHLITLTNSFANRPFNSPNDLVIHSRGIIFFTDPPYGLKKQVLHPRKYQPIAGIYGHFNGATGLLSEDFNYPNGLCLSPDQTLLYVSSNHPDEPYIRKYRLSPGGNFLASSVLIEQNADGMTIDRQGNLFLCTNEGILIISASGKKLARVQLPETPSNITWGGTNRDSLYITARTSIYKITGIAW